MALPIIWFVALAVAFFFLIVRPQRRRAAAQRALLAAIAPGDEVVTSGGLYGRVRGLEHDAVRLEVADGVVLKLARAAIIARLVPSSDGEAAGGEAA